LRWTLQFESDFPPAPSGKRQSQREVAESPLVTPPSFLSNTKRLMVPSPTSPHHENLACIEGVGLTALMVPFLGFSQKIFANVVNFGENEVRFSVLLIEMKRRTASGQGGKSG
jgi:hypothetical protein